MSLQRRSTAIGLGAGLLLSLAVLGYRHVHSDRHPSPTQPPIASETHAHQHALRDPPIASPVTSIDNSVDGPISMQDLMEQYYAIVDISDSAGHDHEHELAQSFNEIMVRILQSQDPASAIESLALLIEGTPFTRVGTTAMAYAGSHIGVLLAANPSLIPEAHRSFLITENEALLTMWSNALLVVAGKPTSGEYSNLIVGFERDMFALATRTNNDTLRGTLLNNLPRSGNYEVVDAAVDWALLNQPITVVRPLLLSVFDHEQGARDQAIANGTWRDASLRDSRALYTRHLVDAALRPPRLDTKRIVETAWLLGELGQVQELRRLRDALREGDFSAAAFDALDKELARLGG